MNRLFELLKEHGAAVLMIFLAVDILAFIMYGIDKKRAKKNEWRISERTLLLAGFCGGAVGALAGMKIFRHKTRHWYFWAVNILGIIWQLLFGIMVISGGKLLSR